MTKSEIVAQIRDELLPILPVSAESSTLDFVEEAIRWYDREGATIVYEPFSYGTVITLPERIDQVLNVIPDRVVTELFTAQTLLLGVTILDYDITTLAMKQMHLADLRTFLASRMRWRFIKPYLYIDGMMTSVSTVMVKYIKHYDWSSASDDIDDVALDWIVRYGRAKFKQAEGRILRMGSVINTPLDGDKLSVEGDTELKEVKDELIAKRSILMGSRSF